MPMGLLTYSRLRPRGINDPRSRQLELQPGPSFSFTENRWEVAKIFRSAASRKALAENHGRAPRGHRINRVADENQLHRVFC